MSPLVPSPTGVCVESSMSLMVTLIAVVLMGAGLMLGCASVSAGGTASPVPSVPASADLVILNARIWTGAGTAATGGGRYTCSSLVSADLEPTALAMTGARISVVGDDAAVRPYIGPRTRIIDAQGRRVIPGITDSHTHIIGGGLQLDRLELRQIRSRAELVAAVAEAARHKQPGEWVLGRGWTTDSWDDPQSPDASWLDPVTGDVPVYLLRMDGHQALVNSAALKIADITAEGPADPPGGEIERDPRTGTPLGLLKEAAKDLVYDRIPKPDTKARLAALERAMQYANSVGVTSVHDMSQPEDLPAFTQAQRSGKLTVRIYTYVDAEKDWEDWAPRLCAWHDDEMFRVRGFKAFMDGSLGSRTAYMHEPYLDVSADEHYPRGQLTALAADTEAFYRVVNLADGLDLQMAVHAIGDEANHLLLDAYAEARRRHPGGNARHRVEHAQHLLLPDIPRFAELRVVASMQPLHKADDGRYAERALASAQLEGSYAYRRLVDSGALVCFGSDWPVVFMNPFLGIDSAVNARTLEGKVWLADHSLTVEEALYAYTVAPAQAVAARERLGTLEVGKLADLVILMDDPLTIPPARLGQVKVAQTIVGGRVVFERR